MAGIYGADVAQLRALGKALTASSTRLTSTRAALSRDVRDASRWKGSDAERFRSDWDGTHSLTLGKVIEALAEAGRAAARHADEQELASGARDTAGRTSTSAPDARKGSGNIGFLGEDRSSPRYPDRGEPNLTPAELDRLRNKVSAAASGGNFLAGNDAEVNGLREALAALKPAQLNQLLASLSDDELRDLGAGAAGDGKGWFNSEGTTPFERQQLLDQLLSKASADQVHRLKDLIPWAQPNGTAMGDAARPGGPDPSTTNQWMQPAGPVIGERPSANDIRQGQYGDCVVLAAAGALIDSNSGWAREHVTDNGNGTVSVLLFDKNGQEQWVTVTSDLPANAYGGQLGAKAGFGGNWPAYVEKALAQVYTEDDNNDGTKRRGTPGPGLAAGPLPRHRRQLGPGRFPVPCRTGCGADQGRGRAVGCSLRGQASPGDDAGRDTEWRPERLPRQPCVLCHRNR
ncbi:C2 family cysteine protease [Arthrobacter sp. SLBN-112]|uniref:C2 family cysteine protease n=1 Tax=Arthrobacter sp. SLBN-112 TaxID=2768452 RepID=UPI0027B282A3|nr:C2 family cysteine protease [Arthrobacter sp. SLBN-112]MDQ0800256.1 hypothetical protein [Arthrobacter sp. SLBN-112]